MENECIIWLGEVKKVFPTLDKKIIFADYKKINKKALGYIKTKIEQKLSFDPEALILGKQQNINTYKLKPKEFYIYLNEKLKDIKNQELRKEIVQFILVHELFHIEEGDLVTISKHFSRRKKKKIHIIEFENKVFERYNELRKLKGITKLKKINFDIALSKILNSIGFYAK